MGRMSATEASSGRGHFTATGAITDQGTAVAYRTVKGNLATGNAVITLRFVTTGKKGAITSLVKIVVKPTTTTSRWTIASGTKAYKGLGGKGTERENADHTVVTMTGTVSREARLTVSASRPSARTSTSPGSRFGAGCSRRPTSSPVVS